MLCTLLARGIVPTHNTFLVNTCGPIGELVLEAFSFRLLYQCYNITDWHMQFGTVDWRDDIVIEQIADMRIRNGRWCADSETEILTERGFLSVDDLEVGDIALTLNHETGVSEWQPVEGVAIFDVENEPMASMWSKTHSSLTTLNHRWPVLRKGDPVWTTSETMRKQDRIFASVPSGDRPIEAKYDDALVELVAWYWTEGNREKPTSKFLKLTQKKVPGKERIRNALWKHYGPPYEQSHYRPKDGSANAWIESSDPQRPGTSTFRVAAPYGLDILDHIDDHAPKTEFLLSLTQEQLKLFVEVSLMADGVNSELEGKKGQRDLSQKSRHNAEQWQLVCILAGIPAHMRPRVRNDKDGRKNPHETNWVVNLGVKDQLTPKQWHYEIVEYTGRVWCPVTANQSWLARRNGKVCYTGNSVNHSREIIGETPIEGGDDAVLVDRQNLVLWKDLADLSSANVQAVVAKGTAGQPGGGAPAETPTGGDAPKGPAVTGESLARKAWREHQSRKNKILEDLKS